MKILIALSLSLALVLAAVPASSGDIPPLPWESFRAATADVVGARSAGCKVGLEAQEILFAQLQKDNVTYLFFLALDTKRYVFVRMASDGTPAYLYIGQELPEDRDRIKVTASRPVSPAEAEAGPCPILYPQQAAAR